MRCSRIGDRLNWSMFHNGIVYCSIGVTTARRLSQYFDGLDETHCGVICSENQLTLLLLLLQTFQCESIVHPLLVQTNSFER